ncbi:lipopolysaccharide assembly protein LapB [Thermococcus sp. AM4]|uniref:tetratricopeptide repeat protein n=1 Tax=Thermococcus sp. (strain AM4) TaxID=246969 RepID=UPI00018708B7|nr:tetratricopeptide repeat protein [Thermococcus sp. AM4]EEB73562.1 tetratricopeptide repeat domain protein [Thermococcus sp. AM4]
MDVKEEWEKALGEKDCEKLLELFDDYIDSIETEEELREELKRLGEVAVQCDDPYDLLHEIGHVYAHLDDVESAIELYKQVVERKKDDPEEYATALYYLADAYEHFGMPEKAIETYQKLLEHEENVLKNDREIALTLANLAVNYDELGETEKAIELMERAREIFERINDEKNRLISLLDLAHFHYELGDYDIAEALIKEVLRNPRDDEIEINAKLVEAEIHAGREDYDKAFKALREALLKAINVSDDIFGVVFDTLVDFIEGLFNENAYDTIAKNMEAFAELFEDDTRHFFRAIAELARWRAGDEEAKARFDELYAKVENEELRSILDEWKRPKLSLSLGL